MEKIRIIVDTASDITLEYAKEYNIDLLRVPITHCSGNFDELDISKVDYWKLLQNNDQIPKTSQITPAKLLDAFKRAYNDGYTHIIVVCISSTGSGMYANTFIARTLFEEEFGKDIINFCFIDSLSYSYAYGGYVLEAATMVNTGCYFDYVVAHLKYCLCRSIAVAGVYTLRFAKKSGRISGLAAFVGEVLGIRPVIRLMNGKVEPLTKVRGDANIIGAVINAIRENAVDIENQRLYLIIGDVSDEQCEKFIAMIKSELNPREIVYGEVGASVATNSGPNIIGAAFLGKERV